MSTLFLAITLALFAAADPSPRLFYEVNGVVSIEAENASYVNLWKPVRGASGTALECPEASNRAGVVRFDVQFTSPGLYLVSVLGRHDLGLYHNECRVGMDRPLDPVDPGEQGFNAYPQYLQDVKGQSSTRFWFGPHTDAARQFHWRSAAKFNYGDTGPVFWDVKTPGRHHIEFQNAGEAGCAIDKLVLIRKEILDSNPDYFESLNRQMPVGKGPVETSSPAVFHDVVEVDFVHPLREWDGFGVNYVETAQTSDYQRWAQDYGGFSKLSEGDRARVLDMVFGWDGLRPGLLKMFLDPYHQAAPGTAFDHLRTTRWLAYFAREGMARSRRNAGDLCVISTLYGPPAWTTRKGVLKSRDLNLDRVGDVARYLVSWVQYLKEREGIPVDFVSLHNEGEKDRWAEAGDPLGETFDYNVYWPPQQIPLVLKEVRRELDRAGFGAVGVTPGETRNWDEFLPIAEAVRKDEAAWRALGLITSHGFAEHLNSRAVDLLTAGRPELHAWTTSFSWRKMDADFVAQIADKIYANKLNGMIPWAVIQRPSQWAGGDGNPGAAFHVTDDGQLTVLPGYYFYKQVTRAGRPGTRVVPAASSHPEIRVLAFGSQAPAEPDAVVLVNSGQSARNTQVVIHGGFREILAVYRSSPNESHAPVTMDSAVSVPTLERFSYTAPARSVTTFFLTRPGNRGLS